MIPIIVLVMAEGMADRMTGSDDGDDGGTVDDIIPALPITILRNIPKFP